MLCEVGPDKLRSDDAAMSPSNAENADAVGRMRGSLSSSAGVELRLESEWREVALLTSRR